MAILQLVDQMTELLNEGREVPLSRYRMVDAEEFSQMLERMRISVPSSIRESERTLIERDNILAGARAEADRIVQEARGIASEMLGENSLVVMARQEAHRIIEDGQEIARQRTGEADGYATQVLEELHEKLSSIAGQVENGIAMMTQQSEPYDDPQYGASQYGDPSMPEPAPPAPRRINNPLVDRSPTNNPTHSYSQDNHAGFNDDSLTERAPRVEPFNDREFGTPQFDDGEFGERGSNESGLNSGGFDNSKFSNSQFDSYADEQAPDNQYREFNNDAADDKPLQAPTLNYLSNPSDPMSDHL